MELHTESRGDLCPDPDVDAMQAVFFSVLNDIPPKSGQREVTGVIIVDAESASLAHCRSQGQDQGKGEGQCSASNQKPSPGQQLLLEKAGLPDIKVEYVADEKLLVDAFVKTVHE